jgi:hypothetical protein
MALKMGRAQVGRLHAGMPEYGCAVQVRVAQNSGLTALNRLSTVLNCSKPPEHYGSNLHRPGRQDPGVFRRPTAGVRGSAGGAAARGRGRVHPVVRPALQPTVRSLSASSLAYA